MRFSELALHIIGGNPGEGTLIVAGSLLGVIYYLREARNNPDTASQHRGQGVTTASWTGRWRKTPLSLAASGSTADPLVRPPFLPLAPFPKGATPVFLWQSCLA